jgi:hypothetical protein
MFIVAILLVLANTFSLRILTHLWWKRSLK